jgi:hypothetical protein
MNYNYLSTVPLENLESDGVPEVRLEEGSHAQSDVRCAGYQSSSSLATFS